MPFPRARLILALLPLLAFAASANDLKLWYEQPAVAWVEALPVGNGRLGAMVFGGPAHERIQFNEDTLWNGGPRSYHKVGARDALPRLREVLAQAGIQLGQANVNAGNSGQAQGDAQTGRSHYAGNRYGNSDAAALEPLVAANHASWSRSGSGMIDTFA